MDAYPGDKKFEPKLNTFSNNPCQRMIEIFVYVSIYATGQEKGNFTLSQGKFTTENLPV